MKVSKLLANVYQFGYVTRDIEHAVRHFGERMGIREFTRLETDSIAELHGEHVKFRIKVALANLKDRQIELIEPIEGVTKFYQEGLDLKDRVAVLHHLGIRVWGPEVEWDAAKAAVRGAGYEIVLSDTRERGTKGTHFAYADTRADCGHYSELLWFGADSQAWHESLADQAT